MAIQFPTLSSYLTRTSSITDSDGFGFQLWVKIEVQPTGDQYIPIYIIGDPALINSYIRVYYKSDGFHLDAWNGTTLVSSAASPITSIPNNTWTYLFATFHNSASGTPNMILFRRIKQVVSVLTLNMPEAPFVENEEWLGNDDTGSSDKVSGQLSVQYTRVIAVAHSSAAGPGFPLDTGEELRIANTIFFDSSFFAVVDLDDETDLTDLTIHGKNWTSVGTPTNSAGPYTHTFSDNFNDESFSPWTQPTTNVNTFNVGSDRGPGWACSGIGAFVRKSIAPPYPTAGTLSYDFALNIADSSDPGEYLMFVIGCSPDTTPGSGLGSGMNSGARIVTPDMSMRLEVVNNSGSPYIYESSAPGVITFDGTPYGITFTWQLIGSVQTTECYINGTLVVTQVHSFTGLSFEYFNRLFLYSHQSYGGPNLHWSVIDNVTFVPTFRADARSSPDDILVLPLNPCTLPAGPTPGAGIYEIVPGKRNDTLYEVGEVKIPDPTFKTGYFGS